MISIDPREFPPPNSGNNLFRTAVPYEAPPKQTETTGGTDVAKITIGYAVLLILIGISFYVGTGRTSVTALIPAFFGVPILICGLLALKDAYRKHAMHFAVILGLLACIGAAMRAVPALPALIQGAAERPSAIVAQLVMAALSLLFVILGVKSFVDVRRARRRDAMSAQSNSLSR